MTDPVESEEGTGASARVRVPSGVTLEERAGLDGIARVELRAPDDALLVEYRPADGVLRLSAPCVEIDAGEDLRLAAGRSVRIEAAGGVTLGSGDASVAVRPGAIGLLAEELGASASRIAWSAKLVRVAADTVETEARRVVERAGEIETHARQIFERCRESFREAEELAQTKAGRLRLVAEDTLRALGRRTLLKAREDMKLRGERIYLD